MSFIARVQRGGVSQAQTETSNARHYRNLSSFNLFSLGLLLQSQKIKTPKLHENVLRFGKGHSSSSFLAVEFLCCNLRVLEARRERVELWAQQTSCQGELAGFQP